MIKHLNDECEIVEVLKYIQKGIKRRKGRERRCDRFKFMRKMN